MAAQKLFRESFPSLFQAMENGFTVYGMGQGMPSSLVELHQLNKWFGHLHAVDDLTLQVRRGDVLGFLGPNGSGKTTTMRMISGFLVPTSGTVKICGKNIATNLTDAQQHIGYLPEGAPAYEETSVASFLNFIANIRQFTGRAGAYAVDRAIDRTNLANVRHQPIGTLSKGFKRRVGLAQALLHDPDILILDEPTDGLDPNQKHEVRELIREISPDKAILVSTHLLEEVENICNRATVISNGRMVFDGTPLQLEQLSRTRECVSLTLPAEFAVSAERELQALSGVNNIEVQSSYGHTNDDRQTNLSIFPHPGKKVLGDVLNLARKWPVEAIEAGTGNLDTVFRDLTTDAVPQSSGKPETTPAGPSRPAKNASFLAGFKSIFMRELYAYFETPLAYVFIVVFLVASGAFTFFIGGFFELREASLDVFFQFLPWFFLFLVPAISMRLWAEERKSGSIELLLTLPVSTCCAALAKYAAAWLVLGLCLCLTMTMWFSVNYLGSPDNNAIAIGYLGSFLMAGGYLAIGAFASALTKNQVIAFVVGLSICFLFTASGLGVVLEFVNSWASRSVVEAISNMSFLEHHREVARGVVSIGNVMFFLSTIVFFLFANIATVENRKGS